MLKLLSLTPSTWIWDCLLTGTVRALTAVVSLVCSTSDTASVLFAGGTLRGVSQDAHSSFSVEYFVDFVCGVW